jgi:hypothetical protein
VEHPVGPRVVGANGFPLAVSDLGVEGDLLKEEPPALADTSIRELFSVEIVGLSSEIRALHRIAESAARIRKPRLKAPAR